MQPKDIRFGSEVIKSLTKGVNILAEAVGSTLGPGGRNVIYKNHGWPYVTKDGVTVARNISLLDEFENIGVQMVKEVANRTCKDAGDGTTTGTILAQAILNEGFKHIERGVNPIEIQRGITKAVDIIIEYIKNNICQDINGDIEKIHNVATVSANWDEEIGTVVGDAIAKVGLDGAVHIEDSKTSETRLELVEGVTFDRGFNGTSPYFITNQIKRNSEMDNPYILLYNGTIKSFRNLVPLLEQILKANAELVIVADNYEPDVLSSLIANKQSGKLKVAAIKSPHFSDMRIDTMKDLAIIYGTTVIDEQFGTKTLSQLSLKDLGRCNKVIIDSNSSSFIGINVDRSIVDEHVALIKKQRESEKTDSTRAQNMGLRIGQLNGFIANIHIGALSEIEYEEKFDRVDDAKRATRAAIEEGIVPGGSYSYIKALNCDKFIQMCNDSKNLGASIGANIIKKALMAPFKRLCHNAGLDDQASELINEILRSNEPGYGFNIKTEQFENLWNAGVIDPFKVTRTALQNAASVAGLMLTSNVVLGDFPETKSEPPKQQIPNLF